MTWVSGAYAALFYFAAALFVLGLGRKIYQYARTPSPLKIPLTPAPTTRVGVAGRMVREVVWFESLFRSSKWTWLFGWVFHAALLFVLARHLRYFQDPVWGVVLLAQSPGMYAGFALVIGLLGLWGRRIFVQRVRYISTPSDHLMLVLLLLIGGSGLFMRFVAHTDIVQVKTFFLGLMAFEVQRLPTDPILLIHLGLVAFLMIIFPISKLLHAPGLFFSPSRNMVDNPREARHIASWASAMEK